MVAGCIIVVVGESGVGKSCIQFRYVDDVYNEDTRPSFLPIMLFKDIEIQGRTIKLQLFDFPGKSQYCPGTEYLCSRAAIIILVYDITKRESFEGITKFWNEKLRKDEMKNVMIGIAGNKCDKVSEEVVSENEAREFAKSINAEFELTSASENIGINDLYSRLINKYLNFVRETGGTLIEITEHRGGLQLRENENKNKWHHHICKS